MKLKRSFRNLLLFPRAQLRHGFVFLGVSTLVHGILTIAAVLSVDAWLAGKRGIGNIALWKIILAIIVIYFVFQVGVFFLGLFISHKWLGPLVAIEKQLEALNRGEYGQRVSLRGGDMPELQRVASSLNSLSERLERGSGKVEKKF